MTAERTQNYRAKNKEAYQYGYDGNAARQPQQWEEAPQRGNPSRKRRIAPRNLGLTVREPGKIAPFAVVGMLAVCLLGMLLLTQYANLVAINDNAVDLRKSMETLKADEAKLLAQYELAYDLQAIEQDMLSSGEMVKPQSGQSYSIELTRPDSAQYYKDTNLASGFINGAKEIFSVIGTYF